PRRLAQRPRQRRQLRRSEQQQDHGENDQNLGRAKSSHDNPLQQGAQVDRTPSPGGCDGRVVSIRESSSRSAERSLSSRRPVRSSSRPNRRTASHTLNAHQASTAMPTNPSDT